MQHEKSHTGGKKFRCNFCSKTYSTAEMFKQHLEKKHSHQVDVKSLEEALKDDDSRDHKPAVKRTKKNDLERIDVPSPTATAVLVTYEATKFIHPGFDNLVVESYKTAEDN